MEEGLKDWIKKLRQTNKLIIVEGKNDKRALEQLGIKNIMVLKKDKAVYEVVEEASRKSNEVIILTDLDKKGKELYGILKGGLERHGTKIDNYFREFLYSNTELSHIEGLAKYLKKRIGLQPFSPA